MSDPLEWHFGAFVPRQCQSRANTISGSARQMFAINARPTPLPLRRRTSA